MSKKSAHEILEDEEFKSLSKQKDTVSLILTLLELFIYFGFISLIAFNKPFLASKLSGDITVGIPIGIGVIVLSWILTGIYVNWANKKYDPMVENVKNKIGG
jgi:uncharacterized membrane protein (DUF485 family)